jgi:chemotaxis receptor (MCP) glutamine deamidase CheD
MRHPANGIIRAVMNKAVSEVFVQADAFRVSADASVLACELGSALAVCLYDDTQGVGGLLHLRYVASSEDRPLDVTDNTLSSDLLLMDRFCKELRSVGARKQSWRVTILAHTPEGSGLQNAAATVLDLVKAYFADSRLPVECREHSRGTSVVVKFDSREGRVWASHQGTAALA